MLHRSQVFLALLLTLIISTSTIAQDSNPTPPYEVGVEITNNGSFEDFMIGAVTASDLNWSFNITANGASAMFEIIELEGESNDKALKIDFGAYNNQPDLDWSVEAVNEPLNVKEGDIYEATFWLKADTETRLAKYYFNLPASGGWARYDQPIDTISTEWKEYTIQHIASATDEQNSMRFSISLNFAENEDATIWINNLSIKKVSEATIEAQGNWSFENLVFGDWVPLVDLEFNNNTTGVISDEQANTGIYSAKIQVEDDASVGALINNNYSIGVYDTLSANVFIPASELTEMDMVQLFLLHGGNWDFISTDYTSEALTADTWNRLQLIIPEGVGNTQRIGIQFVGIDTTETSFLYIDDIIVSEFVPAIAEPEGTWGFENVLLGDWQPLIDLEFNNSSISEVSDEQALEGMYSARVEIGNDASVGALINDNYTLTTGDTLRANIFIEASELAEMDSLQIYALHGDNWDYVGSTYNNGAIQNFGDQWNEVELIVPEGLGQTRRIGVQFIASEISTTPHYFIDNISVSHLVMGTHNEVLGNPVSYVLDQNYPNPFNPTTQISFTIPNSAVVTLEVFNLLGQKVATLIDARKSAGTHSVNFNAQNLSSGIYLYQIQAGSFSQVKRMTLIK